MCGKCFNRDIIDNLWQINCKGVDKMQERKKRSAKLDETAIVSSETMKAIKVLMDQLWLDGKKREFIFLLY